MHRFPGFAPIFGVTVMKKVKIDTSKFKAHSFRHAGATWMLENNVSEENVMKIGRWKSLDVFKTFYARNRTIVSVEDQQKSFGSSRVVEVE